MGAIRVYGVHEHTMVRLGLAAMVAADDGLLWVGSAVNGAEALRDAPPLVPDVVLVGLTLPQMGGAATVTAMRALLPRARFLVLARQPDAKSLRRLAEAGAAGCLPKHVSSAELGAAVRSAFAGNTEMLRTPPSDGHFARGEPGADLTQRELELLSLMARGLSNHDIAARLAIAMPTVKFHVTNILAKLQADNRTGAVLIALRNGLVDLE